MLTLIGLEYLTHTPQFYQVVKQKQQLHLRVKNALFDLRPKIQIIHVQ